MWTITKIVDGEESTVTYATAADALNHATGEHGEVIADRNGFPIPFVELQRRAIAGEIAPDA
jgi:hypothetical protein